LNPFTYFCRVEKICQHIEKLLAQHDYVVVPNLGGFVVQIQSAVVLPDRIIPPHDSIGFNPLMHHSDGLLAIEIAKSEALSYRMAMEYIEIEVVKLKIQLNSLGTFQLGRIGELRQSKDGNILFFPGIKTDFLPMNFGLTDVYISESDSKTIEERRRITFTLPSNRFYKYAAASILIFGLLFVSPKLNDMRHTDSADLTSLVFVNSPISSTDQNETIPVTIEDTITDTISAPELENFHVIIASLPNQKSAEEYCKVLKEEEFSKVHILPPVKTYRVAIQSFSDRDTAIQFMENLRKTDSRFETAWVLCK